MNYSIPIVTKPGRTNPKHLAQLAFLAVALAGLPPAYAQDNLGELEEIVVAADKRSEDAIKLSSSGLQIYGHVQGSYTYNLADPSQRKDANRYRLSDTDHNSFGVPLAKVGLVRRVSGLNEFDAGFRMEIAAGRMVQEVYEDSLSGGDVTLSQGYVDLQIPTPFNALRVRAGRMHSWFGTESLDVYKNPHFSLSPLTLATPNSVTGMSLGMELGGGFRYAQYFVQGWDRVEDNNDSKTFGGQISWKGDDLALALNWVVGAERANTSGSYENEEDDLRWAVELSARWQPAFGTEFRASLLYGQERFPDDVAKFGGVSLSYSQGLLEVEDEGFHRVTAGLRASYLRDQGGARTGIDQGLGEATATLGLHFTKHASLRVEYRRDFSSKSDAFLGSRGQATRSGQDTLSVALHYAF